MACEIIWEENGILFTHSGTVNDQEVIRTNGMMYGDRRFDEISYQISDYTAVKNNLITETDAKVIGTLDKVSARWNFQRMRLAVVTKDEKFMLIVKTYFKQFEGTQWEGRIFETLEKAYDWIKSR